MNMVVYRSIVWQTWVLDGMMLAHVNYERHFVDEKRLRRYRKFMQFTKRRAIDVASPRGRNRGNTAGFRFGGGN